MKAIKFLPLLLGVFLVTGCAFHNGLTNNFNNNNTTVELSEDNFKVVNYVQGDAHCTYIFGIGGLNKEALVEKAKSEMYRRADLKGKPRAIANISVDTKYNIFPIVRRIKVTASGHVIEFEK